MIVVCYGTRPQIVKASRVLAALREAGPVVAIDTGQHYDFELHGQIYSQLGVAPPDRYLAVGSGTHGEQTAAILTRAAAALEEIRPRAVVVIGDTNSTLGAALAAAQLQLPVVHVEAGLRQVGGHRSGRCRKQLERLGQPKSGAGQGEVASAHNEGSEQRDPAGMPGPDRGVEHQTRQGARSGRHGVGRDKTDSEQTVDRRENPRIQGGAVRAGHLLVDDPPAEQRVEAGVVEPQPLVPDEVVRDVGRWVGSQRQDPRQRNDREQTEDRGRLAKPGMAAMGGGCVGVHGRSLPRRGCLR